jgi:hypothetical protein
MSYEFYRLIHFLGLFMVFSALGGQFVAAMNSGDAKARPGRTWIAIFHGLGLVLALVAGFGMLAKLQIPMGGWVMVKLVAWLVLGGMGAIAARKRSLSGVLWGITIALGLLGAYLAKTKPF